MHMFNKTDLCSLIYLQSWVTGILAILLLSGAVKLNYVVITQVQPCSCTPSTNQPQFCVLKSPLSFCLFRF